MERHDDTRFQDLRTATLGSIEDRLSEVTKKSQVRELAIEVEDWLQANPTDLGAWHLLIVIYARLADFGAVDEYCEIVDQALSTLPYLEGEILDRFLYHKAQSLLNKAVNMFEREQLEVTEELLKICRGYFPEEDDSSEFWRGLKIRYGTRKAMLADARGDQEGAFAYLSQAADITPKDPTAYLNLIAIANSSGSGQIAIKVLDIIAERLGDISDGQSLIQLVNQAGLLSLDLADYERALRFYEFGTTLEEGDDFLQKTKQVRILIKNTRDIDKGLQGILDEISDLDKSAESGALLLKALAGSSVTILSPDAIRTIIKAIQNAPTRSSDSTLDSREVVQYVIAVLALLQLVESASSGERSSRELRRIRHQIAAIRRKFGRGRSHHEQMLIELGLQLEQAGKLSAAAEAYQAAIEVNPKGVSQRVHLARIMMEFKRFDAAANLLAVALELEPGNREARKLLAELRRREFTRRDLLKGFLGKDT